MKSCELVSTQEPVACSFTPESAGSYRIVASIADTRGRKHSSQLNQWVAGKGRVLWHQRPDNSLDIMPEKESYRVGDTARYLVKNPFPGAKALISIERYGVLKHWVQTLERSTARLADLFLGHAFAVVAPEAVRAIRLRGTDNPAARLI